MKNDDILSTHIQYTDAYISILDAYKKHLEESTKNKLELKKKFFSTINLIMYVSTFAFVSTIILSTVIFIISIYKNNSSAEIIAGSVVTMIASFVTMVVTIFKLPEIIAHYLFNKKEDKQMVKVIENIQQYEINAVKTEELHNQAINDATEVKTINKTNQKNLEDFIMKNLTYIDPSIKDKPIKKTYEFNGIKI